MDLLFDVFRQLASFKPGIVAVGDAEGNFGLFCGEEDLQFQRSAAVEMYDLRFLFFQIAAECSACLGEVQDALGSALAEGDDLDPFVSDLVVKHGPAVLPDHDSLIKRFRELPGYIGDESRDTG